MPNQQKRIAAEFCSKANSESLLDALLGTHICPFSEEDKQFLRERKYGLDDAGITASNDNTMITKVKLACATPPGEYFVYVSVKGGKYEAKPSLALMLRPEHVEEFVRDIDRYVNDIGGPLMYRGHSVFQLYNSKEFKEMMLDIIKNEPDLREPDIEEVRKIEQLIDKLNDTDYECKPLIKGLQEFKEANRVKPELIEVKEVYLGYLPTLDMFMTAWDVDGSPNTGSVLIGFKIDSEGNARYHEYNEQDESYPRKPEGIYDAFSAKFYAKHDSGSNKHGPAAGRSPYEMITGCQIEDMRIISISHR